MYVLMEKLQELIMECMVYKMENVRILLMTINVIRIFQLMLRINAKDRVNVLFRLLVDYGIRRIKL
jgi:hypothetical protein